jgi:translation initiation factor 4A
MEELENKQITNYTSFDEMELKEGLLRGIYSHGFEKPSTIQSRAIVPLISGSDMIAQSQSGTGKTGTFSIGVLQLLDEKKRGCQAMIVAHTKELARQISEVIGCLGKYTENLQIALCTGGIPIGIAKKQIGKGPCVVVGTPGRIIDMIEKRIIKTEGVKILVLDEADELLSIGFRDQMKKIISSMPVDENDEFKTQMCIFSATLPRSIVELTDMFMKNPVSIRVKHEELTLEGIRQYYVDVVKEINKLDTFLELYQKISVGQSIVYVNTKRKADWLKDKLEENNFTISVIHSDLEAQERKDIMKQYRNGKTRILISTNLLSRGIDIQQVSVVINYDLPNDKESYLHRIGRSGRYGRKGTAINFTTDRDNWKIGELERFYETQIESLPQTIVDSL